MLTACHQPDVPVADTTPPLLVLGWQDGAHVRHSANHSVPHALRLDPVVYNEDSIYHFTLFCTDRAVETLDMDLPEEWEVVESSVSTNGTFVMDPFRDSGHLQRVFVRSEEDLTGYFLELDVKVRPSVVERPVVSFTAHSRVTGFDSHPATIINLPVTIQRTPF